MFGYIYLLQTRESIKNHENIYKIGRTSQDGLKRFQAYPKGSELILHMRCFDPVTTEKHIISIFDKHFIKVELYGNEYYQGNLSEMTTLFCKELHYACYYPDSIEKYESNISSYKLKLEKANQDSKLMSDLVEKYKNDLKSTQLQLCNLQNKYDSLDIDSHENISDLISVKNIEIDNETINNNLKCNKCNRIFKSKKGLKKHELKCTGLHPLQCEICFKMFTSAVGKCQHKKNVKCTPILTSDSLHTNESVGNMKLVQVVKNDSACENQNFKGFYCDTCGKNFPRKKRLEEHMKKCDGLDPKQCKICFKTFASRNAKYQHKKYVKCNPPNILSELN